MSFKTPILLIVFNRLDTTIEVFKKIKLVKPKILYIASDGPRENNENDIDSHNAIVDFFNLNIDWDCSLNTLFRDSNLGCKYAVSSAIDWIFSNEEKAIILEDDCVPEISFFYFSELMLERYKNDDNVMMISGTNYLLDIPNYKYDYFFSNYYSIWGWATWKRAWKYFDINIKNYPFFRTQNMINEYGFSDIVKHEYIKSFDSVYRNEINTWDIQWFFSCLLRKGLTIVPIKNQITNIGVSGTHTSGKITRSHYMPTKYIDIKNIRYSNNIDIDNKLNNDILLHIFGDDKNFNINVKKHLILKVIFNSYIKRYLLLLIKKIRENNIFIIIFIIKRVVFILNSLIFVNKHSYPVILRSKISNKKVLYSYISNSINKNKHSKYFDGHSNKWESYIIANIFLKNGYSVFGIDWNDRKYIPDSDDFSIIFDIHGNLSRLANCQPNSKKILHLTGSFPTYSNKREMDRINAMILRRGGTYLPKRQANEVDFTESLDTADYCTLIGTYYTLNTYPEKYHNKITLVPVSGSKLKRIKSKDNILKHERQFLWYFGSGAVHKGLDLLLEIFGRREDLFLNIMGDVASESDFCNIYKDELFHKPNIKYWGTVNPSSKLFYDIANKCIAFISPSCSEGISPAAVTCMQFGLYPIASLDTGIMRDNLPGIKLLNSSIFEIETAIENVLLKDNKSLLDEILILQKFSIAEFSRDSFRLSMEKFLLKNHLI